MNNKITLELYGIDRTLLFDFGAMDYIQDATDVDPMQFAFDVNNYTSLREGLKTLIYAGHRSYLDSIGSDAVFTLDDAAACVKRIGNIKECLSIIEAWGWFKSVAQPVGEDGQDTQQPAADVA